MHRPLYLSPVSGQSQGKRGPSLSRFSYLYYTFVLRMNNVNDRCLLSPIPPSRQGADQTAETVGAKVKPFSESAKSIGVFSPDFE